jgi:hypothetical protein
MSYEKVYHIKSPINVKSLNVSENLSRKKIEKCWKMMIVDENMRDIKI